jgi:Predicted Zn-dependent protease (DUF2268)
MSNWSIHCRDFAPDGPLAPFVDDIEDALGAVERRVAALVEPFALDIFIQADAGNVIPERGFVGYAPAPGAIYFTFDPANPNMAPNLGAPLERMIAHEYHHAMRWYGVGYGRTLIEALVSEGLAGRFVEELFASEPEPWERALPATALPPFAARALAEGDTPVYDHASWFFGRGSLPRWVGYTLGWALVGHHLKRRHSARPSRMAATPARDFLPSLQATARG